MNSTDYIILRKDVHLTAPITKPSKILGIGLNYKDGAKEMVREKHEKII